MFYRHIPSVTHYPVCIGAERPIVGECAEFPEFIHGKNGIGNVELPPADQKPADLDQAAAGCREEYRKILAFLQQEMKWYMRGARMQNWMRDCCPFHDPLAMIAAVDPSIMSIQKRITRIECKGEYCRGMVVTDLREHPITGRYVGHCMEADAARALNTLFAVFQ